MEPLTTAFTEGNFSYTQLMRQDDLAIYEQRHKAGRMVRYEVIRIRVQPETTWPNGYVTPAHEAYPGASTWGRLGFTFYSRQEADAWLAHLQTSAAEEE